MMIYNMTPGQKCVLSCQHRGFNDINKSVVFFDIIENNKQQEGFDMVKLYDGGVYLVDGATLVPEADQAKVEAMTGKAADKEGA